MSQENVDAVRAIFDRWERGDFSSADWMAPEIEFVGADGFVAKGAADVGAHWFDYLAAWDKFVVFADEINEATDDQVLVYVRFEGHGRESGIPIEGFPGANLFTVKDGKVTRLALYIDKKEALKAAELTE
jgi:ketosteroid isomerase-like protein